MGLLEELGRARVLLLGVIGGGVMAGFWEESDGVKCFLVRELGFRDFWVVGIVVVVL